MACPLSYPDKFHAASKFWSLQPAGTKALSQENQLLLYALNQQATVGPNTTAKPWGWNVVERTMWQGWYELGKMSAMEAMRLFVKTLDEEQADWWQLLQQAEASEASTTTGNGSSAGLPAAKKSLSERSVLGLWTQLPADSGKKPLPRYEQGAALAGDTIYVVGGNYGGRYLGDVWGLDTRTCAWSQLNIAAAAAPSQQPDAAPGEQQQPALPPLAGHSVTAYGGKLYVVGGHVKGKEALAMPVRVIDPAASTCAMLATSGDVPVARGGHAASLVGSSLWVFGGEDAGRKALGDVSVLDLSTQVWSQPQVSGKGPSPRSASAMAVYQDRYLLVFGGGSVATCFSDLFVLDTQAMAWSQPLQQGAKVSPRAGHTGVVIGDIWYIVGGGNNVKGCTDLLAADLSELAAQPAGSMTWHVVASVALRDPLSSEGISLVALPAPARVMVAFGGYNGKYQNAVSLFRAPTGSAALLAGVSGAAAPADGSAAANGAKANGAAAAPPAAAAPKQPSEAAAAAAAPAAPAPAPPRPSAEPAVAELKLTISELKAQLEGARKEAESAIREAAAAKDGAAHELTLMRKQLNGAQQALNDSGKALEDAREALAAEQTKVLKLEAHISELQAKLGQMGELEKELEKYRRQQKEAEAKKAAAGIWGYIAGTPTGS